MALNMASAQLLEAIACLSTGTRLTVVFLTFSVLAQGGGGLGACRGLSHLNVDGDHMPSLVFAKGGRAAAACAVPTRLVQSVSLVVGSVV